MTQHLDALKLANRTRAARTRLRAAIRNGDLTVTDVLLDNPPEAATMMLRDLLKIPRGWGDARISGLCDAADVHETQQLGRLTDGGRARLLTQLAPRPKPEKPEKPEKPARVPRSVPAAPLTAWINRRFPGWTNREIADYAQGAVHEDLIRKIRRHPETEVAFGTVDRLLTVLDRPDLLTVLYSPEGEPA